MNTPIISFRIRQDQQADVRELVNYIKDDPELIGLVLEYVRNAPQPRHEAAAADESLGPFRNAEAALSVLTMNLAIAFNPDAIFLFGSRACGTERSDSDFDLMVVTPDDQPLDYLTVRKPISGCGVPVDVVPCRYSAFEKNRKVVGMLPYAVDREGKLLDARVDGPFWKRYRETYPLR